MSLAATNDDEAAAGVRTGLVEAAAGVRTGLVLAAAAVKVAPPEVGTRVGVQSFPRNAVLIAGGLPTTGMPGGRGTVPLELELEAPTGDKTR